MQSEQMLVLQQERTNKRLRWDKGGEGGTKKGTAQAEKTRQRNVGEDRSTWDRCEVKLRWRVVTEIQNRYPLSRGAETSLPKVQRELKTTGSLLQQLAGLSGLSVCPQGCPGAGGSFLSRSRGIWEQVLLDASETHDPLICSCICALTSLYLDDHATKKSVICNFGPQN